MRSLPGACWASSIHCFLHTGTMYALLLAVGWYERAISLHKTASRSHFHYAAYLDKLMQARPHATYLPALCSATGTARTVLPQQMVDGDVGMVCSAYA